MSEGTAAVWQGPGGGAWVRLQGTTDAMFAPIADFLVDQVAAVAPPDATVVDIGCGTGVTTLAIARRLGHGASVTGVDVSEPMLDGARKRTAQAGAHVQFVAADAQRHRFAPGTVDVLASRFGVMFFDDADAAFANLRAAARAGAALRMVVWRGPEDNPFMTTAERAAADLLPLPRRHAGEPGQFGLADHDQTVAILRRSGWTDVAVDTVDFACAFEERELTAYLGHMGPVGRELDQHDDATRTRVVDHVRPAFERFVHDDAVRFTAACWLLVATA